MRTFKIITLGCKVNQYESASLGEALGRAGWREAEGTVKPDLVVVNTCIVTQRASYQSRQAIRKATRENPWARIAAVGCYAQVFPRELEEIEGIDLILGNREKLSLASFLEGNFDRAALISEPFENGGGFEFAPVTHFPNRTRAFLKIQDGCESFCSYCIVPYARGPFRSLKPELVLSELERLSGDGYREVVLTGIHLGAYGREWTRSGHLKSILARIDQQRLGLRIRLSSLEPQEIDEELVGMVCSRDWLCRHFHVPLQSGDDGLLRKMNRVYTSRYFENLVKNIHDKEPLTAIGVDVLVGFPGEDDRAFRNSYDLIKALPVSYLHVFPFSPRKGTPAAHFPQQVRTETIKERAAQLRELGQMKRETFQRSCLGKRFMVLTEGSGSEPGSMTGFTDNYLRVIFQAQESVQNKMVAVILKETGKGVVRAEEETEPGL